MVIGNQDGKHQMVKFVGENQEGEVSEKTRPKWIKLYILAL